MSMSNLSIIRTICAFANCIVTPHTSWFSAAVLGRTFEVFSDNLRRYRAGEPRNLERVLQLVLSV